MFASALFLSVAAFSTIFGPGPTWAQDGYVNRTYHDHDSEIVYLPDGEWMRWPYNGCLDTGGQWTRNTGGASINFVFTGVAIYAYALFDDYTSHPIWTVSIDGEEPVRYGTTIGPEAATPCDPIFTRTGLEYGEHTFVLTLTGDRPGDNQDMSFDGFIVTSPENPPDITTGTHSGTNTITGDEGTRTNGPEDDDDDKEFDSGNSRSRGKRSGPDLPLIIGIAVGVVVVLSIIGAAVWYARKRKAQKDANNVASSSTPFPTGGLPKFNSPVTYNAPPNQPNVIRSTSAQGVVVPGSGLAVVHHAPWSPTPSTATSQDPWALANQPPVQPSPSPGLSNTNTNNHSSVTLPPPPQQRQTSQSYHDYYGSHAAGAPPPPQPTTTTGFYYSAVPTHSPPSSPPPLPNAPIIISSIYDLGNEHDNNKIKGETPRAVTRDDNAAGPSNRDAPPIYSEFNRKF